MKRRRKPRPNRLATVTRANAWQAPPKRPQHGFEPLADVVDRLRTNAEQARADRKDRP